MHSAGDKPQAWLWSANPGLSDVLTDRVKYHDLYLSTGCCSYAVNAVLKPLYPLSEDLQYSRPHASRSALKLHYQQPSRLSITRNPLSPEVPLGGCRSELRLRSSSQFSFKRLTLPVTFVRKYLNILVRWGNKKRKK